MPNVYDFDAEKRRRRYFQLLQELMADASHNLQRMGFAAEGLLVVIKSPGSDGPTYRYLQEGFTPWDLKNLVTHLAPSSLPATAASSDATSSTTSSEPPVQ